MKDQSGKKEISKEGLKKLAQILRDQNISLRKLVRELELEEEKKSNIKLKINNIK